MVTQVEVPVGMTSQAAKTRPATRRLAEKVIKLHKKAQSRTKQKVKCLIEQLLTVMYD